MKGWGGVYLIVAAIVVAVVIIVGSFLLGLSGREHASDEGPVQPAGEESEALGRYLSSLKDIGYYVDLSGDRLVEEESVLELLSLYYDETGVLLEYTVQGTDPLSENVVLKTSAGAEIQPFAAAFELEQSGATVRSFYPPASGQVDIVRNSSAGAAVARSVAIEFRTVGTPTRLVPVEQAAHGSAGVEVELEEVQIGIVSRLKFRLDDTVRLSPGERPLWLEGALYVSGDLQAWQVRAELDSTNQLITSAGRIELSQPAVIELTGIGVGDDSDLTPLGVRWDFLSFPD